VRGYACISYDMKQKGVHSFEVDTSWEADMFDGCLGGGGVLKVTPRKQVVVIYEYMFPFSFSCER
jgi:hypothetical protein